MHLGASKRPTEPRLHGEGFASLYVRYSEMLLGFFMRRVYDHQAAFDLTAETFAQMLLSRRRFRGTTDAELEAWTFAIARAQLARYRRKGRAERKALERLAVQTPTLTDDDLARIEELADLARFRDSIAAAIGGLSDGQREAVELRIIDELTYPEVAERLGISEPTARARVSRALRTLGAAFKQSPEAEEAQL
jgi:RNA polymerase sigma factor (sigma-70 family)